MGNEFINEVWELIKKDEIQIAIDKLCQLLKNSKRLDDVVLQSARYNSITKQIRLGLIDINTSETQLNQIRYSVIDILRSIEDGIERDKSLNDEFIKAINPKEGQTIQVSFGTGDNIARDKYIYSIGIQELEFRKEKGKEYNELGRQILREWGDLISKGQWDYRRLCISGEKHLEAIKYYNCNHHFWRNLSYIYHLLGETSKAKECLAQALII